MIDRCDENLLVWRPQVDEQGYSRLIDHENTNRVEGVVDVRGVDHALAALTVGDAAVEDKHPEK